MNKLPQVLQNEIWEYVRGDRAYWKQIHSNIINEFFPAFRHKSPKTMSTIIKTTALMRQVDDNVEVRVEIRWSSDENDYVRMSNLGQGFFTVTRWGYGGDLLKFVDANQEFLRTCRQIAASFE